jgi:hypothetical protein
MPSGKRTSIGFTFIGGRPIRGALPDIGISVKAPPKAISLIDCITDIAYDFNQQLIGAPR